MKRLGKAINPSQNTNPFNHNTNYLKLYTSVKNEAKDEFGQLISPLFLDSVLKYNFLAPIASKVRVSVFGRCLHMREVQVFGYNDDTLKWAFKQLSAKQWGDWEPAINAVDGNNKTLSHTGSQSNPCEGNGMILPPVTFPCIMHHVNPIPTSLHCVYFFPQTTGGR